MYKVLCIPNTPYSIPNTRPRGLTVIELLIVAAIVAIVGAATLFSLSSYQKNRSIRSEAEVVVSYLSDARSKTLASVNFSSYGVHFEDDSVTIFEGSVYDANDADNIVHEFDESVEISDINLSGGAANIVFERLTGDASAYGTIEISLVSGATVTKTITITSLGAVSSN